MSGEAEWTPDCHWAEADGPDPVEDPITQPPGASVEDQLLACLSRQIGELAEQLTQLQRARARPLLYPERSAFSFAASRPEPNGKRHRNSRPALPVARAIRQIIRQRQLRARFFDGDLFADPAWDILLDLTAARLEHRRVSVTSLCIASGGNANNRPALDRPDDRQGTARAQRG